MVSPHAVAITTVGPVHIENFPEGEVGVALAKAEIFEGLERGGVAVLNADDRWFPQLKAAALDAEATVRSFGAAADADARLVSFTAHDGGAAVEAVIDGAPVAIRLLQSGAHWGPNSLCVLLMLEALDVDRATALRALADFAPLEGRGAERRIAVPGGDFVLIDESYNANPISMGAALKNLGARPVAGRRIVALTDMLELGADAPKYHAGLAGPIEDAAIDKVFCAGPLMESLWEALPQNRRGGYAETADDLAVLVAGAVGPGDAVMVKGSNGSRASRIAAALSQLGGVV
jgi:UDP-N-acetylmuramoyl-tripeptide--D-alanyl-D-alanine ligase